MARLHSVLALGDFSVATPPFQPIIVPIPHPRPGVPVAITRTVCRIHILAAPPTLYATTLLVLRASDLAPMGGAATDTGVPGHERKFLDGWLNSPMSALADRETLLSPDHFHLDPQDGILAVYQAYGQPGREAFMAKLDLLYSYTLIEPPKFVSIARGSGNDLIGVKDDGSVWRAADATANPLAWVLVSPPAV